VEGWEKRSGGESGGVRLLHAVMSKWCGTSSIPREATSFCALLFHMKKLDIGKGGGPGGGDHFGGKGMRPTIALGEEVTTAICGPKTGQNEGKLSTFTARGRTSLERGRPGKICPAPVV